MQTGRAFLVSPAGIWCGVEGKALEPPGFLTQIPVSLAGALIFWTVKRNQPQLLFPNLLSKTLLPWAVW